MTKVANRMEKRKDDNAFRSKRPVKLQVGVSQFKTRTETNGVWWGTVGNTPRNPRKGE